MFEGEFSFVQAVVDAASIYKDDVSEFKKEESSRRFGFEVSRDTLKSWDIFKGTKFESDFIENLIKSAHAEAIGQCEISFNKESGELKIKTEFGSERVFSWKEG